MSSYFPNRWPLSYLNLIKKYENTHKAPTAQKNFKHQDIKQKEPTQKYRLGTIDHFACKWKPDLVNTSAGLIHPVYR